MACLDPLPDCPFSKLSCFSCVTPQQTLSGTQCWLHQRASNMLYSYGRHTIVDLLEARRACNAIRLTTGLLMCVRRQYILHHVASYNVQSQTPGPQHPTHTTHGRSQQSPAILEISRRAQSLSPITLVRHLFKLCGVDSYNCIELA